MAVRRAPGPAATRPMRILLFLLCLVPVALGAQPHARNVILFLADAGGTSAISAASLHGYGAPRRLFVQRMPHIALADTSSASHFVTDSAAAMTAIVTGERTNNGVIGQSAAAVRKKVDGAALKTILEHAEERGLSTGLVTNDSLAGATPAALYAKANDRGLTAVIFQQIFTPRFGDGVDVLIGAGRGAIAKALTEGGLDLETLAATHQRPLLPSLDAVDPGASRALVLLDSSEFDLGHAVQTAVRMLSRNPRGYFLMVESDAHTNRLRRGLNRLVELDRVIERTTASAGPDTLVLFTGDHSFDVRLRGGQRGRPILEGLEVVEPENPNGPIRIPAVRMENGHTGEEVLVAAQGPGAERVRGYMANTDIFRVMMAAYGWALPGDPNRP